MGATRPASASLTAILAATGLLLLMCGANVKSAPPQNASDPNLPLPSIPNGPSGTLLGQTDPGDFDAQKRIYDKERGCRDACTLHGRCDPILFYCVCEPFWTQNPFRSYLTQYGSNCDWNVFVVIAAIVGIAFACVLISIILHACLRRLYTKCEPRAPPRRYRLLPDDELEGFGKVGTGLRMPRPARSHLSDSEDEDETVYEAKKYASQGQWGPKPGDISTFKK